MLKKPPLSFIGNKSKFRELFTKILEQDFNDKYVYVDLFGGSGYLSYVVKCVFPNAEVIYNDYDNYFDRIKHIKETNNILQSIKDIFTEHNIEHNDRANNDTKTIVVDYLKDQINNGQYVDIRTITSQILFSGNSNKDFKSIQKQTLYNRINKNLLNENQVEEYIKVFDNIEITHCDYIELYNKYKDIDNVVFLVDPPYLDTRCDTYNMNWQYIDFIKVLSILNNKNWFYFTSNKTKICQLLKSFDETFNTNILANTTTYTRKTTINGNGGVYDDIMIVKKTKIF